METTIDAAVAAESSTVATTETAAPEVPRSAEDYAQWRLTGKTPETVAKPKEDSATSKPSVSSTASEAVTGKQEKTAPKRDNAADRLKELLDDLKQSGYTPAELKTLRKQAAAEAGKTTEAPKVAETPQAPQPPKKPVQDDYATYDLYDAAIDKWHEAVADYRAELKLAERDRKTQAEASAKATTEKLDAAGKRYGEESKSTITETAGTVFNDPKIAGPVKALIDDSPVIADLLYTLGSKADDLQEFVTLARTNPGQAIRKVVLMERLIAEELAKGDKPAAGTEAGRDASGKFTPPAKKVTEAPPPPKEAGGRSAAPPDPVDRAAAANDFTTYRSEANRRDLARRTGR
jgi:hypothetical protein